MNPFRAACLLLLLLCSPTLAQTLTPEQLRLKLRDLEVRGDWNYDDLSAGFAKAKRTGKPLLVILRCVL